MFYRKITNDITIGLTVPPYAEPIFKLIDLNRMWLRQWLSWLDTSGQTVTDTENFIKTELLKFQQSTGLHTTIFYQDKIVGVLGFNDIHHGIGRAGYWLNQAHTGKGIMTRCLHELIHIGFKYYPIGSVEIHCAEGNTASQSLSRRLNFVETGRVANAENLYGLDVNHIILTLKKQDFHAQ